MSKNVYLFYFAAKLQLFTDTNKNMDKKYLYRQNEELWFSDNNVHIFRNQILRMVIG